MLYIIPLLLLGGAGYLGVNSDFSALLDFRGEVTSTPVVDQGAISVYFCPRENCADALVAFLDTAQESIHCALFEIDQPDIQRKLLEKNEMIEVQVVTDNDYLYEFNHSFVVVDTWGLQHNKFCVVDGKKVSTGSMNPTINGDEKNNNNLILVTSELLARNYEAEFQEMWAGTFKKGDSVGTPEVLVSDILVKSYFCPEDDCAKKVRNELEKATTSVHFMTFSFTHESIGNILLLKHQEGIAIQGVMEARQVTQYSRFEQLLFQGIDVVKDGNKQNMHHKVFIIDEETVVTGSFNPSNSGDTRNDENVLIITDADIAARFMEEFRYVWDEAQVS
jgi:phosphatidylserine/phosphatidylglycerophosphate/cardiolipin synthase-like enzyme